MVKEIKSEVIQKMTRQNSYNKSFKLLIDNPINTSISVIDGIIYFSY